MRTRYDLEATLRKIDRRGYKAYKEIAGTYDLGVCTLYVDRVQGDPFAAPSLVRLRVPHSSARFPAHLFRNRVRRIAFQDYLIRIAHSEIRALRRRFPVRGSGKSGHLEIDAGGQEVVERSAGLVTSDFVELRLAVGLPAAGRTVLGAEAARLLLGSLPALAGSTLYYPRHDGAQIRAFVDTVENFSAIQGELADRRLVSFVADGALLPRAAGNTQLPLERSQAVLFQSPPPLRVAFEVPNQLPDEWGGGNRIGGMGIPEGITLIVGGGFHGKSTLLNALAFGVYPHVPGDGREYVVTRPDAVKIRAEDGRRIEKVDISGFISLLPGDRRTDCFSTDDASGSTSQAANIVEALEAGSRLLLLDEDTSATNFMVRDARMQALVRKDHEPITPFIDRVRELYNELGVSTVLVMGGSGDYLDEADTVLMMREYLTEEVTAEARRVASQIPSRRSREACQPLGRITARVPQPRSIDASRGRKDVKIDIRGMDHIRFGQQDIDIRHVEQLVDPSQVRAVGFAINLAASRAIDGRRTLGEVLDWLDSVLDSKGLDVLNPFAPPGAHPGNFARPRRYEIAASLNRLRTLRVKQLRR
ncbi:MAG TPA: ATPase [Kiritimatiellae bacterium]|nr:ATPase [Kiritimatiellia bacterium]